jgi:hypothetical protein
VKHASILPAGVLAIWSSAARAGTIEIQHDPLACVPLDRYARISARGAPADQVASAELQFRANGGGAWYSIRMTSQAGDWSAVLPRPTASLGGFEYRLVMASKTLEPAAAGPYSVRVSGGADACVVPAESSLSSSIVVGVPAGAPVVPPVPEGFSPAGAVAAQERERAGSRSKRTPLILAGLGLAGGAAAIAVAAGSGTAQPALDIPSFAFDGASPNPDSVLSLSRGSLQVFVRMSHEPEQPLTFIWRLDLRSAAPGAPLCLYMTDVFVGAQRPTRLVLTAPLNNSGACGDRFEVEVGRLTIGVRNQPVLDATLALPYKVEP